MQPSLQKFPRTSQKFTDILVRHPCSTQVQRNRLSQHSEASYMMKYAPKYYHSLTLEVAPQGSLLSKVKRIKKLKKFKGLFNDPLPHKLWVNLLGNTRKEIEELPEIICTNKRLKLSESFWNQLNLHKVKSFSGVKRILMPKKIFKGVESNFNDFLCNEQYFVKYLGTMTSLKSLKILVREDNYGQVLWFIGELNGMNELLDRLEILALDIMNNDFDIEELLFQNKNVLSHLTGLSLSECFDPLFADIPLVCKNLKTLSLEFETSVDVHPEILDLLVSIRHLEKLVSFELDLNGSVKGYWRCFKPQSSLRSLKLKCEIKDLVSDKLKTVPVDWKDIEYLDFLEFTIWCNDSKEVLLTKSFITKVLKKVRKLRALKFWIIGDLSDDDEYLTHGPFEIEEVAHLYESLENFEFSVTNQSETGEPTFDLRKMKAFKNLKEVNLGGDHIYYKNIEEMVDLLQKKNYSVLKVDMEFFISPREVLEKIVKRKRMNKNLKMKLELNLEKDDLVDLLDGLGENIGSLKKRKGLEICLPDP